MEHDVIATHIQQSDLTKKQKERLQMIVDRGLSGSERAKLAEQVEENPGLLLQLNKIFELKEQFANDAASYDEILEEEEKLLEQLQLGG